MLERWKGMLYLMGAFTLAGTSVITAWLLNGKLGAFTITAASLLLALLCMIPLCMKDLKRTVGRLSWGEWGDLFFQALLGMFLFRMLLLHGLLHTSTAEAGILTGTTPAFTVMLAFVFLKESVSGGKLAGIFSTVGGILVLQGMLTPGISFKVQHVYGNLLVLCAALSESGFNLLSRIGSVKQTSSPNHAMHPGVQTTLVSAIAFLLCLIPAGFEVPFTSLAAIGLREWFALIWYGPIVTAVAFIMWYAGIKRCHVSTAAAFSGMMPFTALLLSVIVLKEPAGWEQWGGGILVVLGMFLIGRQQAKSPPSAKQLQSEHGSLAGSEGIG
ncbi:DMT family transporter [Paenibacillus sp. HGF5]|uniref:DMT family transporter n=1 Tax=Paenibacillus sp. HGF5 TaxID=908341 RepID=UPI00030B0F31|nr:DMT family transporter [Paenibacillus sp. HGF5]